MQALFQLSYSPKHHMISALSTRCEVKVATRDSVWANEFGLPRRLPPPRLALGQTYYFRRRPPRDTRSRCTCVRSEASERFIVAGVVASHRSRSTSRGEYLGNSKIPTVQSMGPDYWSKAICRLPSYVGFTVSGGCPRGSWGSMETFVKILSPRQLLRHARQCITNICLPSCAEY
jgi:hypothetical protein